MSEDEQKTQVEEEKTEVKEEKEETPLEMYQKAGKVAHEILQTLKDMAKPGVKALDLSEKADAMIAEAGMKPAFPLNIAINNHAAHYTCPWEDDLILQEGDVVKIDVGVHYKGFIADTALTVAFDDVHNDLIKASKEATETAVKVIRVGNYTGKLGDLIENIIEGYGFSTVKDLSGHLLMPYLVHGPKTIPNVSGRKGNLILQDEAYAIETFATTGAGESKPDKTKLYIVRLAEGRFPLRTRAAKDVRNLLDREYHRMPVATRWIYKALGPAKAKMGIRELINVGALYQYHVLSDTSGSFVSQHEHTVYMTEEGPVQTT
ncbi:MAG: type II methionyl aminopeptidase [Candidatus Heimdallarchaeum aukensis]|uniref:Methionine aminopeptidase n=1 Tax=Candidatus Heimdallarchaeum aukensis TaxID=2876573 RepID=A0A9Y1BL20_9ARCH|nr:MAG: type II methionyl aminopeptidase [Candidatus Heimdallarchaeum aukensis]UJG40826.1 MAG: type II methionyl aminopeptidase [Candidatus Heimdallarchaeum aukensis]